MPDAIPARWTGTDPVSECDAGVPANPTPTPISAYPRPTFQYEMPSFHSSEHRQEAEEAERVADEEREPGPLRGDELCADLGAITTISSAAGRIARPAWNVE